MGEALRLEVLARSRSTLARRGRVHTPHGSFDTPAFMPVGTRGTVKGILPHLLAGTGAQICLGNTYHLLLRPGPETVEALGGLHEFMGWRRPILTDSGGYQAFSMADLNTVTDDGVTFKSIVDGSSIALTPERAIRVQNALGADIIMAFDDCPPSIEPGGPADAATAPAALAGAGAVDPRLRRALRRDAKSTDRYDQLRRLKEANERTVRWLERCKAAHARPQDQALFGIVQGGTDLEARAWSAERITQIDLPGYAIGGVAVGESSGEIARVVRHTAPLLPEGKPRYLMGVGYERDLLAAVLAGVDMFDCVLPTRNGRNANAFTAGGQVRLRNAKYARDPLPLEPGCDCLACRPPGPGDASGPLGAAGRPGGGTPPAGECGGFSRAYLRHLFQCGEMLGPILVTLHNLRHFQRFMQEVRETIETDDWPALLRRWPAAAGAPAA